MNSLEQQQANAFLKDPGILDFMGHMVSIATTQLCNYHCKATLPVFK